MTKQDIVNMINCKIQAENKNYEGYMNNNLGDTQREHDHQVILSVYSEMLHDLNMN